MPYGILIDFVSVLIGGVIGAVLKNCFPSDLKRYLPDAFALAAVFMGISLMIQLENLPAVVLALIFGTAVGELLHMERGLVQGLTHMGKRLPGFSDVEQMSTIISLIVLFCFSGTGVFGAINEAMTGDHTMLLAKSILDFFTALIFGTTVGYAVALIAVPMVAVALALFMGGLYILPLISPVMLADFKACGGIITFTAGLKIAKFKEFRIINMLPSLILVLLISHFWTSIF